MDDYERSAISEAFVECKFEAGQHIITKGEEGKTLYFLVDGEAFASKVLDGSSEEKEVAQYKSGDYFGELALLNNEPR